jgi:hypothetical protein
MARQHKGQHKVPRTYLEAFTNADGRFWVANDQLKIYPAKPHNVLTERDFYTVRFPSGGGTLLIETEFLGGIESAYAEIYRTKLKDQKALTEHEKGVMAIFVASMLERSPRRREAMQQFFDEVTSKTGAMQAAVDAMTPEERAEFGKRQPPVSEESHKNSIPASEFVRLGKDVPSLHSSEIPRMVAFTAPILFDMKWGFMPRESSTGDPFITSDSPAVLVNPSIPYDSFWGPGLGQKDVEITIPLSPDLALLIGWQIEYDLMYIPVATETVSELNRRLMRQSDTLISNDKTVLERQAERVKKFLESKETK